MSAGKLDRCLHAFASRTGKKNLGQLAARSLAQPLAQFASAFGDMRLDHRRPATFKLFAYRSDHRRMVVAYIVNAIPGEEIQDPPPVRREQLAAETTLVTNIHLQQIQQTNPLRVYMFGIGHTYRSTCSTRKHFRLCVARVTPTGITGWPLTSHEEVVSYSDAQRAKPGCCARRALCKAL